jgi:hypothetical protein
MVKLGTKQPVAEVERYTRHVLRVARKDAVVAKVAACVLAHFTGPMIASSTLGGLNYWHARLDQGLRRAAFHPYDCPGKAAADLVKNESTTGSQPLAR